MVPMIDVVVAAAAALQRSVDLVSCHPGPFGQRCSVDVGGLRSFDLTILPFRDALVRGVDSLRRERIAEDFTRLRTLADLLDECWLLAGAAAEWRAIARDAHFLADSFERRTRELFETLRSDRLAGEPFTEGFARASSLRITARLAAGDDEAARKASEASAAATGGHA